MTSGKGIAILDQIPGIGKRLCYFKPYTEEMKLAGFLLLISGWGLVVTALGMLSAAGPRGAFALAGVAVEILGLVMTVRTHLPPKSRSREIDGGSFGGQREALR
jgi:hypothetical protein